MKEWEASKSQLATSRASHVLRSPLKNRWQSFRDTATAPTNYLKTIRLQDSPRAASDSSIASATGPSRSSSTSRGAAARKANQTRSDRGTPAQSGISNRCSASSRWERNTSKTTSPTRTSTTCSQRRRLVSRSRSIRRKVRVGVAACAASRCLRTGFPAKTPHLLALRWEHKESTKCRQPFRGQRRWLARCSLSSSASSITRAFIRRLL